MPTAAPAIPPKPSMPAISAIMRSVTTRFSTMVLPVVECRSKERTALGVVPRRRNGSDLISIVPRREQQNAEDEKHAQCCVDLQFGIVQRRRECAAQTVDLPEQRKCGNHPKPSPAGGKLR